MLRIASHVAISFETGYTQPVTEVLFYHLTRTTLDRVLPDLLERTLQRGWRAVVQTAGPERVEPLDALLWTYKDESFLPHAVIDETAADQPILITAGDETPNAAQVRFFVDGAEVGDVTPFQRAVILFDGHDDSAVTAARRVWKRLKQENHTLTYWQQNENGRFEKKA